MPRQDDRVHGIHYTRLACWLLPAVMALLAYAGVYQFGFVFDDDNALVTNEALRAGDWWNAAFGNYNSLSNRPLSCLSLALDFRMGLTPGAMHVVSLGIHLLNTMLVARIVRRLVQGHDVIAIVVASIWAVHPLSVDAVAYLTQRSMLCMAFFALGSFYAVLRTHGSPRPRLWQACAVLACALAMASKEESAALPILLVLADRAFGSPTWAAWRTHYRFHLGLLASWSLLLVCVTLGPTNPTVGYHTNPPATAWQWLLTQTQCLSHYVRSVFVPNDLRGMYDFTTLHEVGPALLPGLLLVAVLLATILAFRQRPALGFAGAWFFLWLAPTSSIYPIITEPCADRRMYLPLLAFAVPLAAIAHRRLGTKTFATLGAIVAALLVWQTREVAATYRDQDTLVAHAAVSNALQNQSFLAGRILSAYARVQHDRGRIAESHELIDRAMRCAAPGRSERLALANARQEQGRIDEAEQLLRLLLRDYPDYPEALGNLAALLHASTFDMSPTAAVPKLDEAEQLARRAVALGPRRPELQNTMAVLLHGRGRTAEALPFLERALHLRPDFTEARRNLGIALLDLRRPQEALDTWAPLQQRTPNDPLLQQLLAMARAAIAEGAGR